MFKVCFLSHHYKTPQIFLDSIIKMSPGKKGIWKDMEAITDPSKADFVAVFDGITDNRGVNVGLNVPMDRTLYFGEHPRPSPAYTNWPHVNCLAKFPLDDFLNPGEWWLDYDYDYLMQLERPEKTKNTACIFTGHTHNEMYRKRKEWIKGFCEYYPEVHLYGRPKSNFTSDLVLRKHHKGHLGVADPIGILGQHTTGKEGLIDYKYSIEFDIGPTKNYMSERFYDAMFMWCMPFYFGSSNVHEFLPSRSFHYIDVDKRNYNEVVAAIESNSWEDNLDAIAEARFRLLNKYQIWPYVYDKIQEFK